MSDELPIKVHIDALFANSGDPIFLVNAHRRVVFFNQACQLLTGVSAVQILGRECRHHGPLEAGDAASVAGSLCPPPEALAGKPETARVLLVNANGERLARIIHFIPLAGRDGELSVILGRIADAEPDAKRPELSASLRERLGLMRKRLFERYGFDHIVAVSPAMQRVFEQVQLASQNRTAVLLRGEKGTGKQELARTIHYQSAQRDRTFVALDCEALPVGVLEHLLSEEIRPPEGLLADESVGTIYLREPARLPRDLQERILASMEKPAPDIALRFMAGTTIDLERACRAGTFLEALYYRLSPLIIDVPPLRERKLDLPLLAQQVLERCNTTAEHQVLSLHPAAWELVRTYDWLGNLAEFTAILAGAHERAEGPEIHVEHFPARLRTVLELGRIPPAPRTRLLPLDKLLLDAERRLIELALREARGNKSKAAARLEISRARLYRRMQLLGIQDTEGNAETEEVEPLPEEGNQ